ncbi:VOC family protein [Aminipila terrae]|uniref:Lactoylglutathione lyase n=1 Tax=Aminipila terrae TaxID=2697030 RepID=A0A6P1MKB9_9FIRM|nr:VOC family protein [Aminipila terrae]QHI72076.1 lactoylglutathione lyase [Aminipila terrae]
MKIHHVGYLVKDINKALKEFGKIGFILIQEICYDSFRDIEICFVENSGYILELVSPKSEESIAWNLLKKYGNAPYHICYIVENLEETVSNLKDQGYVLVAEPKEAIALRSKKVAFLIGRNMGLIELVEI